MIGRTLAHYEILERLGLDYPSWSPDGARLYFSVTAKTGDIYVTEE